MIVEKQVSVADARFRLCGHDSDPYYQNIETHLQHGFLIPLLAHHVTRGASIIDVGANIGGTMALMHRYVESPSIVCLEPSDMFPCLEATVAANGYAKTRCVNACAGNADGFVSFVDCGDYIGAAGTSASHSHIGNPGKGNRQVPVHKLDTIVETMRMEKVDFVKIDVEGFEADVLDGMTTINARHRPMIFMEFNAFCVSVYAQKSPYTMLQRVRDEFGGFIGTRGGKPRYFQTDEELLGFLFTHMTENGCVEDIVFSARPGLREAFAI